MRIGNVIRKYRKAASLTQEEMAERLGVTASAVNKWENEVSLPDIVLLAPIARLLGITPDILLAFREELTQEEIRRRIYELDGQLQKESYEAAFSRAKKAIEEYPNCAELKLSLAVILDAGLLMREVPGAAVYEERLEAWYLQCLDCEEEGIRLRAAESLFAFYLRKDRYEQAEACLGYFSDQNPEKKSRQAELYAKTGRREEAYTQYEELLFAEQQRIRMILARLLLLAKEEGDSERAAYLMKKQKELEIFFETGAYYVCAAELDAAVSEESADLCFEALSNLWEDFSSLGDFSKSRLYEHMKFKELREEFLTAVKKNFGKSLEEDAALAFLREDARWPGFLERVKKVG